MLLHHAADLIGRPADRLPWLVSGFCSAVSVSTTIIAGTVRLQLVDYVIYIAADVLLACLQLIPLARHENPFPVFTVITLGVILAYAAAIVIFRTKDLKSASGKWFNV